MKRFHTIQYNIWCFFLFLLIHLRIHSLYDAIKKKTSLLPFPWARQLTGSSGRSRPSLWWSCYARWRSKRDISCLAYRQMVPPRSFNWQGDMTKLLSVLRKTDSVAWWQIKVITFQTQCEYVLGHYIWCPYCRSAGSNQQEVDQSVCL
jgi:hypothetical protein